jgi:hypothetical protein
VQWIQDDGGGARPRYTLECGLCGLRLRRRGERMTEVLDKLAINNHTHVTIAELAAIL